MTLPGFPRERTKAAVKTDETNRVLSFDRLLANTTGIYFSLQTGKTTLVHTSDVSLKELFFATASTETIHLSLDLKLNSMPLNTK